MTNTIFIDISLVLSVAIAIAYLVQMLRQPMIISYIITGILCGPLFLNLINSSQEFFHVFAEFGVILLLFLVGISLNLNFLKRIGRVAVFTGLGQVLFTSIIGFLLILALGFTRSSAIYLAVAITFSSTIIIVKLLNDKKEMRSVYGRYTMGLMLVQDIVAISIMMLLPSLQSEESFLVALAFILVKVTIMITLVGGLSKVFLPVVLEKAAKTGEFLFIFTLAWCFATAGLGEIMGLSLEVGAILAGLALGSSVYQTEISSRIKPLRDFFIAMFFIILGSEMSVDSFGAIILPSLALSLFVLVGNPLILYFLYRRMKFSRKNSFMAGVTAAQVSEFGFVFLFVAQQANLIKDEVLSMFTIIALVTIFVSSYLITYNYEIYRKLKPFFRLFGRDKRKVEVEDNFKHDVLIFGYHRLGWKICEAVKEMGMTFAVVDYDPSMINRLTKRDIPCYFGDCTDVEFLSELPIHQAKMIISTLPNADDQIAIIKHVRRDNSKAMFIGNLAYTKYLDELYEAGADFVILPHLISGEWAANILKTEAWNRRTTKKLCREQKAALKLVHTLGHKA